MDLAERLRGVISTMRTIDESVLFPIDDPRRAVLESRSRKRKMAARQRRRPPSYEIQVTKMKLTSKGGPSGLVISQRRDMGARYRRLLNREIGEGDGHHQTQQPLHTNEILDYFGFRDGSERAALLRSFTKDYHDGADLIRTSYHLARFFGLQGKYENTTSQTKETFIAIAKSVHKNSTPSTDLLIDKFGLGNMPVINKEDYVPLELNGRVYLAARGDLEFLLSKVGAPKLESPTATYHMWQEGFTLKHVNGLPVYSRR